MFLVSRCFVEHLTDSVYVISDRSALLLLVVQQINGVQKFQIVYLAKDFQQLAIVYAIAYECQVNIRALTEIPL